jgi:hypothetical protein
MLDEALGNEEYDELPKFATKSVNETNVIKPDLDRF